ncbi:lipoprotein, putative [Xanthomonas oryzae pv. oryzicola BLS256]|uniref:Lipoprotein, putative n=1 Tax=Xanthomonas oryzae pv. oryzicola (strain BLS256) TaxID=383407 RepID=G7THB8_XANOB|nr:lipoprotein, putative [Xanthomonas oryzae pv. oryzicola BLS256]
MMPALKRALSICGVLLMLAGCGAGNSSAPSSAQAQETDTVGLSLFGLNYTDVPIGIFYVNGVWGGNSTPYAAGLSTAGSIGLPAKWHPGIKVKVQWRDDLLYDQDKDALTTAEVEVPRYGKIYSGYLLVAFLPGRKVKVYASGVGPGHKDAPDGLENPGEFCLKQPGCDEWYDSGKPPREGHY